MNLNAVLFAPPVVFFLLLAVGGLAALVFSRAAAGGTGDGHALDSYACGQKGFRDYVNPDYNQFFTFAFIFTVIHVLTMVVATAPRDMSLMPVMYLLAGVFVIYIVLKR